MFSAPTTDTAHSKAIPSRAYQGLLAAICIQMPAI